MSDNPIDDVGSDAAQMLRIMLQLAALIMMRTRTRSMEEAKHRAKEHNTLMKEAREQQLREARTAKMQDPRNRQLAMSLEPYQGVKLTRPMPGYDSPERRMAIATHLAKQGVSPELAAVRMLIEVGQAQPAIAAVGRAPVPGDRRERHGQQRDERGREIARERW